MVFYLESKETRKVRLINLLYSDRGCTVSELSKFLSISPKTVRLELDELSSYLAPWAPNINLVKSDNIWSIKKSVTLNLEHVYSDIKKNSFQFTLILAILLKSSKNYSSFLKKNYYSNGSGYQKIKAINHFLESYGISVNTKNLTLVGDELTIRLFIYKMLKEVKFVNHITRYPVIREELESKLDHLKSVIEPKFVEKEYEDLLLSLFIIRQRKRSEYIQLLENNTEEINSISVLEIKEEYSSIAMVYALFSKKESEALDSKNDLAHNIKLFNQELKEFFKLPCLSAKLTNSLDFIFLCYSTINAKLASVLVDVDSYQKSATFLGSFDSFYMQFFSSRAKKNTFTSCFYLKKSLGMYLDGNLPKNNINPKINIAILVRKNQINLEKLRTELTLLGFNLVFFEEDKEIIDVVITNYYEKKNNVIYLNQHPTEQEMIEIRQILSDFEVAKKR